MFKIQSINQSIVIYALSSHRHRCQVQWRGLRRVQECLRANYCGVHVLVARGVAQAHAEGLLCDRHGWRDCAGRRLPDPEYSYPYDEVGGRVVVEDAADVRVVPLRASARDVPLPRVQLLNYPGVCDCVR